MAHIYSLRADTSIFFNYCMAWHGIAVNRAVVCIWLIEFESRMWPNNRSTLQNCNCVSSASACVCMCVPKLSFGSFRAPLLVAVVALWIGRAPMPGSRVCLSERPFHAIHIWITTKHWMTMVFATTSPEWVWRARNCVHLCWCIGAVIQRNRQLNRTTFVRASAAKCTLTHTHTLVGGPKPGIS